MVFNIYIYIYKKEKTSCERPCDSVIWHFVRVIFHLALHNFFTYLDYNKILLIGYYYFHQVFNLPLSYFNNINGIS